MISTNGFLIAAPQSGSGKTTVTLAIMAALRRRGVTVAPFKCGPDFIDPGYHRVASGRPSINLDAWMCPEPFVRATFARHAAGADLAIIEGVMGLFDGLGSSQEGSSAQVAAITGAPVVLVVNARGMAASAAALVKGFTEFDPAIRLAGVIFNNVGSVAHGDLLRRCLSEAMPETTVFGCLPRRDALEIPSRHLGLVTAEESPLLPEYLTGLAELAEEYLDLEGLTRLAVSLPPGPVPLKEHASRCGGRKARIAVARDAAFCFMYEDNLRLLREAGAELVFFSPLGDACLPSGTTGIYLPGGYPELHAEQLAANTGMLRTIREAVAADMTVYAECGGFIYLTKGMEAAKTGSSSDFAGIFPTRARMLPRRKALGYRHVDFISGAVLATAGGAARGHEFHYSEIGAMPAHIDRCYRVSRQGQELGNEGFRFRNCLASYIHLHFGSNEDIAPAFVAACRDGV